MNSGEPLGLIIHRRDPQFQLPLLQPSSRGLFQNLGGRNLVLDRRLLDGLDQFRVHRRKKLRWRCCWPLIWLARASGMANVASMS